MAAAGPYSGAHATVLGASGFIGLWVTRALVGAGARVTAVVRSDEGRRKVEGVGSGQVDLVEHVLEPAGVGDLLDRTSPDVVFNLATYGVDATERDESTAERVNAQLVEALCSALAARPPGRQRWPGQRLVHVGSALEYGEVGGDLNEDTQPRPTTTYGRTKLAGTRAIEAAVGQGIRAVTARLFMVYGPGEQSNRLVPSLIEASHHQGEIPLTDGRQRRDFTYVEDVVDGLLRAGAAESLPYATVNLATGRLREVREAVRVCAGLLGIASERLAFGALPTRREEMAHDPVNIQRLSNWLGWRPPTPLEEGLRRTVADVGGPGPDAAPQPAR